MTPLNCKSGHFSDSTLLSRRLNPVESWKLIVVILWITAGLAFSQEKVAKTTLKIPIVEQVNQNTYAKSNYACGPTCLLMQFQSGTPQMRAAHEKLIGTDSAKKLNFLVERFFKSKRSELGAEFYRWGPTGVFAKDLEAAAGDWLEENEIDKSTLRGMWLDREDAQESDSDMVRRIHRNIRNSIKAGVPPILSLRTFVVRENKKDSGKLEWKIGQHHFVLVTEVPDALVRGDIDLKTVSSQGFPLGIVDPNGGLASEIFVFHDSNDQRFNALKGNEMAGHWMAGTHFLQVAAPTVHVLRPMKLKWSERVVTVANFLIGDF